MRSLSLHSSTTTTKSTICTIFRVLVFYYKYTLKVPIFQVAARGRCGWAAIDDCGSGHKLLRHEDMQKYVFFLNTQQLPIAKQF
jgi:hypothetical protein